MYHSNVLLYSNTEFSDDRVNGVRHERGKRLWFDVSDVPVADTLVGAEVRLYKIVSENEEDLSEELDEASVTITMYQVIEVSNGYVNRTFS